MYLYRYEAQRSRGSSMLSSGSQHSAEGDAAEEYKVFLGDDQPVVIGQQQLQREQVSVSWFLCT